MLVIAVEALAQHLVGIAHDEKGGGVGLLYRPLQGHDLLLLEGAHEHVFASPDQAPAPRRMVTPRSSSALMERMISWGRSLMI